MSTPVAIRYSVPPKQASLITVTTVPDAECSLSSATQQPSKPKFLLYADQDGVVRFHVTPGAESDGVAEFVLECNENGNIVQYPLELRPSKQPTEEHPAPAQQRPKREGAYVRPALSAEDSSNLTVEELSKRGYPPRPDPDKYPEAFLHWKKLVSKPATFVPSHAVSRRDVGSGYKMNQTGSLLIHERPIVGTEPSGNWSGFELRGDAGTYSWVEGTWIVPAVSSFGKVGVETYSSLWVGLDGDGLSDLVQAGTTQQSLALEGTIRGSPIPFDLASYWAWTEFLPQQQTSQQVSSVSVAAGDEIFVFVTVGDGLFSANLSGPSGIFWIQNDTNGEYTFVETPRGTTNVVGSEAVWIMERPTIYGSNGTKSLATLADYGTATMSSAYAGSNATTTAYGDGPEIRITMSNGPDVLSTVTPLSSTSMQFNWKAYS